MLRAIPKLIPIFRYSLEAATPQIRCYPAQFFDPDKGLFRLSENKLEKGGGFLLIFGVPQRGYITIVFIR